MSVKNDFFKSEDGTKIHYITTGIKGSWVVLIHGFIDTAQRMFFSTGIDPALAKILINSILIQYERKQP